MLRLVRLVALFVAVLVGGLAIGGQRAAMPALTHAAPVMSLRHIYVPVSVTGTTVSLPATATVIGCTAAAGPSIAYGSGCLLLVSVPEGDPLVTRTFRGQITRAHPINTSQYDGAVEHPVAWYFQRSGTGAVTPYVILEAN